MSTAHKPGIYRHMPFDEYCDIDAVNNSRLSLAAKSLRHYKHTKPAEGSRPLWYGSLIHAGILEPLTVPKLYCVMPPFHLDADNKTAKGEPTQSTVTKYCRAKQAEFIAANRDKQLVTQQDYDALLQTAASIDADKTARKVFGQPGEVEVTLVWEDDETGLLCKARIDKLNNNGTFADLKTTARIDEFSKSIYRFGYHRQLAHYQAGYIALTGEILTPWIVAVESSSPYCVQAAPMAESAIEQGEKERRGCWRKSLMRCRPITGQGHRTEGMGVARMGVCIRATGTDCWWRNRGGVSVDFRKLFKSEWFTVAEIEGNEMPVTITKVTVEKVKNQGGEEECPAVHFEEHPKALVLNKTNAKSIAAKFGNDTSGWPGQKITLRESVTTFGGEEVPMRKDQITWLVTTAPFLSATSRETLNCATFKAALPFAN